ncbi:MAG: phosphatidylserine decarboxylase family protein [Bacteroidota bacterium]
MLSKYGLGVLLKFFGLAALAVVCCFTIIHQEVVRGVLLALVGVSSAFVLSFFRDPDRSTPQQDNTVISPADGKVVVIKELFEPEYLKTEAIQVSIFMSPLNVHVNRFPISGIVKYFRYIRGDYIVAFDEKSSEQNERTHIGMENKGQKVLFKQIAGAVARRIVVHVNVGQTATAGERFGMIKFGSRVDVIVPKGTEIVVRLHENVRGGETILARFSSGLVAPEVE